MERYRVFDGLLKMGERIYYDDYDGDVSYIEKGVFDEWELINGTIEIMMSSQI